MIGLYKSFDWHLSVVTATLLDPSEQRENPAASCGSSACQISTSTMESHKSEGVWSGIPLYSPSSAAPAVMHSLTAHKDGNRFLFPP